MKVHKSLFRLSEGVPICESTSKYVSPLTDIKPEYLTKEIKKVTCKKCLSLLKRGYGKRDITK